jgi:guanine deaminase
MELRARVLTPTDAAEFQWIEDAVLSVQDGRIAHIGPYDGRPVTRDLRPDVLLPGFVDGHLHFPQTRIIGSASGPLLTWLAKTTFPEETKFADRSYAQEVARSFCDHLARAGTTLALVYGSVHAEASEVLLEEMDRRGLRAIVGPVLMDEDCPTALQIPADRALPALEGLVERWHGRDDRLRIATIPRFALSCSKGLLQGAGRLAETHGLWSTTHLSENPAECALARERFGTDDYLQIYEDAGLVNDRSVFAHCIHLSQSEWDRLAAAGAVVAHCPDSNDFLGSGGMPLNEVLSRNIPMTIGTDVAAGRSFRVPHILASAYDNALRTGTPVTPATLLWWGTRGGALALGHPEVGALQTGLEADLIQVRVPPWADGPDDVLASVLFDRGAPEPVRTWVRGRRVAGPPLSAP